MSADRTSPKEIAALLRLASAALDLDADEEIAQLVQDLDATAAALDAARGILPDRPIYDIQTGLYV